MSGHCELCGETGGHSAACVSNPYQAANQRVIIATLTADLSRLTAELERKQREVAGLREQLTWAVNNPDDPAYWLHSARVALSAGENDGNA